MINWKKRVAAAEKRGEFTKKDRFDASNWHTCLTSENPKLRYVNNFSDYHTGTVSNGFKAGMAFHAAVESNDFKLARKLLKIIPKMKSPKSRVPRVWGVL